MHSKPIETGGKALSVDDLVTRALQHIEALGFDRRTRLSYQTIWNKLLDFAGRQIYSESLLKRFMINEGLRGSDRSPFFEEGNRRSRTWQALIFLWRFASNGQILPDREGDLGEFSKDLKEILSDYENY